MSKLSGGKPRSFLTNALLGANKPTSEAIQQYTFSRRAMIVGGLQIGIGAMLAGRMAWISVAENEKYQLLSESNRVNLTLVPPRREIGRAHV